MASILAGPVAAAVGLSQWGWAPIFWAMIICDLLAAFLALLWLKPLAARTIARAQMGLDSSAAAMSALREKAPGTISGN
jgi:predicted MFS family arabinose efflux permease